MEGVGAEAASLAGHLGLDQPLLDLRQQPHHHRRQHRTDVHRGCRGAVPRLWVERLARGATPTTSIASNSALEVFQQTKGRPTFIVLNSHIGYGSPNRQGTAAAHGEPLGHEEIKLTKRAYGWPEDATFLVPDGVREHFAAGVGARGRDAHRSWTELFGAYRSEYANLATRNRSDATT